MLTVEGLSARYGDRRVLQPTDLSVADAAFVAILGPNGAGKTTLMRAIMGLVASEGSVRLHGQAIDRLSTARRAAAGITLVPEGRGIFAPMTVAENLSTGMFLLKSRSIAEQRETSVLNLFPRLRERYRQRAGSLSGGEQQMLAVARALVTGPKLLLLDEPSLGLAPKVIDEIIETLQSLRKEGLTIVIVEQKAPLLLKYADTLHIMVGGRIRATRPSSEVRSYEELSHLYFS